MACFPRYYVVKTCVYILLLKGTPVNYVTGILVLLSCKASRRRYREGLDRKRGAFLLEEYTSQYRHDMNDKGEGRGYCCAFRSGGRDEYGVLSSPSKCHNRGSAFWVSPQFPSGPHPQKEGKYNGKGSKHSNLLLYIDVLVVKHKHTDDGEGEPRRKSHKIPHGISPVFASSFPCEGTSVCVDTRASHYPFLSRRIFVAARAGIKIL